MNITEQKAVIFDMDGVLIDSEGLWKQAEHEVFTSLGVSVTDEHSDLTKTMTTSDVTKFWFERFPWRGKSLETVEQMVISRVIQLIDTADCETPGVKPFIERLKTRNYKVGLATNSPNKIIPNVLKKLAVSHLFDTASSAEYEIKGKPDPAIYLTTAANLHVMVKNCVVFEDSYTGMLAAKAAGMRVIAFTNGNANIDFEIADFKIDNFEDFNMELLN